MKKYQPYIRKPGDQEIRILRDGRVVMIAPDESLLELAETLKSGEMPETPQENQQRLIGKDDDGEQTG